MSRFSTKARYTRAIIPTVILFLLSLAADLVILFTLGRSMITPDTFHGAFAIYLLAISLPIGVAFGFLTCFATRHSGDARVGFFLRQRRVSVLCLHTETHVYRLYGIADAQSACLHLSYFLNSNSL